MSEGELIAWNDCPPVAWKNGGGTTRAIATFPAGAGLETFAWRLSAARVDRPGTFSHFAGIDRTIAILSGQLHLAVAGRDPITLAADSAAYAFPGDVLAYGTPLEQPVLDLNLMVRRGRGVGALRCVPAGAISGVTAGTLLVATQPMTLRIGDRVLAMQAHDAFHIAAAPGTAPVADAPMLMASVTAATRHPK